MAPKVIQKTYQKNDQKSIEKSPQNNSKMEPSYGRQSDHFRALFRDWFFQGAKGPPGTQNERFWLPKWAPKAPKMSLQSFKKKDQETTGDTENATQTTDA